MSAMRSSVLLLHSVAPGESPPPPPRACFGRDELVEKVVGLAETLTPIALIGAGGIGKTAIALTVLHHSRIKARFGDNRRFIRCDQFPASRIHFLNRLSKAIGAEVDNPEDLAPLRPFLSSREMILVLDNAESILDPQGTGAQEIHTVVEELSRFETICLCVTSRISTVPRHCKRPMIPTLSIESASDIFYSIYDNGDRSDIIHNLLRRLDFHALSITLLATTASYNMWDQDRLVQEWNTHRVRVLRTDYNEDLAATIELSLTSPMFRKLDPDARDLLGVIAFLPQGVNEKNVDWLFPTIPDRRNVFDKFCVLSLTYRSNGFITMLAPLRDYLYPKDPTLSPLLRTTKECYFNRLSVRLSPDSPGFGEAQWIISEDINVEHLLDVFTTADANSAEVWDVCACFMEHLRWHKRRLVMLGPKIESLLDDHPSKPGCLLSLSWLLEFAGHHTERKQVLVHTLRLWREQGNDFQVAQTLGFLSDANRLLNLYEEGIQQAKEASEIYDSLDDKPGRARSRQWLARLLYQDNQLDAAEEAASRALALLPQGCDRFDVCKCHRTLGVIYHTKGKTEQAIHHLETALGIASSLNLHDEQFWIHRRLAELFFGESRFDDAHAHIGHAKSAVVNEPYLLGHAMDLQGRIWYEEGKFELAKAETLCAADVFEKLGSMDDLEVCRSNIRLYEEAIENEAATRESC